MLLEVVSFSYNLLLMRSKKVYLSRSSFNVYSSSSFSHSYNPYSVGGSFLFNSFVYGSQTYNNATLFFENSFFYNNSFSSYEYSSAYFNSYNILHPILAFCVFVNKPFVSFFSSSNSVYYWDAFSFLLASHINIFFPWIECSLNSYYFSSQVSFFNTRREQLSWASTMLSLSNKFINVSNYKYFFDYNKYSCAGLSYVISGSVFNNTFCRVQKRANLGDSCLSVNGVSPSFVFSSVGHSNFVCYWGSSSIRIFWDYSNIL